MVAYQLFYSGKGLVLKEDSKAQKGVNHEVLGNPPSQQLGGLGEHCTLCQLGQWQSSGGLKDFSHSSYSRRSIMALEIVVLWFHQQGL